MQKFKRTNYLFLPSFSISVAFIRYIFPIFIAGSHFRFIHLLTVILLTLNIAAISLVLKNSTIMKQYNTLAYFSIRYVIIHGMKWPEALIINNHTMCNLRCAHCQGPNAESMNVVLETPKRLPNRITFEEMVEVVGFLNDNNLIGNDRITAIRFGGNWSEPTLDPELPKKLNFLLGQTENTDCRICVITNGVDIPSGNYDEKAMRAYFEVNFGFENFPPRFSLAVSIDGEHLSSYARRRSLEAGVSATEAQKEYLEKVANLVHHADLHGNVNNLGFNAVEPVNAPVNFCEDVRRNFRIPDTFNLSTLRRAIYTPKQEGLVDAVNLAGTAEPPKNCERCYFLTKRGGKVVLFPDIASFGYNTNPVPFRDFKFPNTVELEIAN